jgi:hypothetical protein
MATMKTYFKDFSICEDSLAANNSDLRDVASNRYEKFKATAEYQKAKEEAGAVLERFQSLLPEERKDFSKLEDYLFWLEYSCFSAGYRDGIGDLMATMTFNKLGLTKVEYCDLKGA